MKKRIFSLALAVAMAISMNAVVFAGGEDPGKWDVGETGSEVTGGGTTQYVDTEVVSCTLPTDDALNFTLDPIGLLSIGEDEEVALDELEGGAILGDGIANIINESSRPIKLSVEIGVTGDAEAVATKAAVEEAAADADNPAPNNVLLYAVASSEDLSEVATKETFSGSENGFILGDDPITLDFALSAAEYVVKEDDGDFEATITEGTGHGTALMIGGFCNTLADWSEFASDDSEVGVEATFTFARDDAAMAAPYEASDFETLSGEPAAVHLLAADDPRTATDVVKAEGLAPAGPYINKSYTYEKGSGGLAITILNFDKLEGAKGFSAGTFTGEVSGPITVGTNCTWNGTTGVLKITSGKLFDASTCPTGDFVVSFKVGTTQFTTKVKVTDAPAP